MERAAEELTPEAALSALAWWADAGVDVMVDETPRDWLRSNKTSDMQPRSSRAQSRGARDEFEAAPLDDARDERSAASQAPLPDQLDLFQAYLRDSGALPYAAPSARRVCPAGDPASGLMFMTAMPAGEDCSAGTLISGEAGALFDRMLKAMGRDRQSIYLAALSCVRSPDGRLADEPARQCATLARHHIGLAAPRVLVLMGDACGHALLGLGVNQGRGRWHEIATHAGPVRALLTFSPEFLQRMRKD